ncbi:MAG: iron-only hydrogenase system regulator [bacterium]|nr:iron-only hydrogenase system regulator [bacterium]
MESRIAVIGILVYRPAETAGAVQDVLSRHASIVVGRMGIPYRERGLSVIALIVDGTTDQIGALSGQLGRLAGVRVKTAVTSPAGEGVSGHVPEL